MKQWLSPEWFTQDAAKAGPPENAGVLKSTTVDVVPGEDRQLTFTLSTADVDRDRDTIAVDGWNLTDFARGAGAVTWAHDYAQPPVARATRVWVEGSALKATAEFATKDLYPFGDMIYRMYKAGFLNAVSVGFQPVEWVYNEERRGVDFKKQNLLEFACVPVPSNPHALIEARSAGVDVEPMREWASKTLERLSQPVTVAVPKDVADAIALIERAVPDIKRFYSFSAETKKVPGDVSAEKAPQDEAWSAPSLGDFTDKGWGDLSDAEKKSIAGHFAWSSDWPPEAFGDLKLPHHRASDGAVVFRGVVAAAGRLNQAEGVDEAAVKRHLAKHYHQFDEKAPWEGERAAEPEVKGAQSGDDGQVPEMPGMPEHMRESGQHFARAQAHVGNAMASLSRATHAAHAAGEHDHADAIHDVHNKMAKVAHAAGDCMRAMAGSHDDDNDAGAEPDGDTDDGTKAVQAGASTAPGETKADTRVPGDGVFDASAEVEIDVEKVSGVDEVDIEAVSADEVELTREDVTAALREFAETTAAAAAERAIARLRGRVD